MSIDLSSGLWHQAVFLPSPFCNTRPAGLPISLMVVHAISLPPGQFVGDDVVDLFTGNLDCKKHPYYQQLVGVEVSAHIFIRRTGEAIQCVPFHQRAWHAGVSRFGPQVGCNDFSIGIELEGTETSYFTAAQYEALNALIAALRLAYPSLQQAPVVGHSDIAPLRKLDPGVGFDWSKVIA